MSVSKKKILISINTSWNVFNFRLNLIKALMALNYEIHVLAPKDDFSEKLVDIGCFYHPLKMQNKGNNPFKDLSLLFSIHKNLTVIKPDIALFFTIKPNIYGSMAARNLGIPFINNVTGLGTAFLHKGIVQKIVKKLYKIAFNHSNKVFFQNVDDQKLFEDLKIIQNIDNDVLPGSGINLNDFQVEPLPSKTTFYFVSRLLYDKGINELIVASKNLKSKHGDNFRLVLIGKEETSQNLGIPLSEIKQLEKDGVFEYEGTTENIKDVLKKASVVVLPSYREGTSRVLLEAAAMGRPLITSDAPGCKQLIADNGWLCKVKSISSLEEVMEKALLSPVDKLEELGKNSRKLVESAYDEQIVINTYIKSIKHIL